MILTIFKEKKLWSNAILFILMTFMYLLASVDAKPGIRQATSLTNDIPYQPIP